MGIAGISPAGLLVEQLAESIEERALRVRHAAGDNPVLKAQCGEFAHRMRQDGDPDAELLELGGGLIDAGRDAALMQAQREGETANSGADNCDLYRRAAHHGWDGSIARSLLARWAWMGTRVVSLN